MSEEDDSTAATHPDLAVYLEPSGGVDSASPRIIELSSYLTRGAETPTRKASALFNFVRDTIRYIPYAPFDKLEHYEGEQTLDRGYGFCTQKSSLLIALARAASIPARFHFADLLNHNMPGRLGWVLGTNRMVYHTYVEMHLGGSWCKATPSFEAPLCQKMGWRLVEFDGSSDATLHATDLLGRPHIEYLLDRGTRPAVPLDDMLTTWADEYGLSTLDRWESAIFNACPKEASSP